MAKILVSARVGLAAAAVLYATTFAVQAQDKAKLLLDWLPSVITRLIMRACRRGFFARQALI